MRKILLALAFLPLFGCTALLHPIDPEYTTIDHRPKGPRVTRAWLAQAYQICTPGRENTAPVDIFVLPKHPGVVKFIIDGHLRIGLEGDVVHLLLQKVGYGPHVADVYLDDEFQVTVSWTVWNCGPIDHGDLYKPDGSGLKDYCNCPTKEELCTPPS